MHCSVGELRVRGCIMPSNYSKPTYSLGCNLDTHHEPKKLPQSDVGRRLLRVKRAERPSSEFWTQFEAELRAEPLAALVRRRPWWSDLGARTFGILARYGLPVGAAAAVAMAGWVYQAGLPAAVTAAAVKAPKTRSDGGGLGRAGPEARGRAAGRAREAGSRPRWWRRPWRSRWRRRRPTERSCQHHPGARLGRDPRRRHRPASRRTTRSLCD